MNGGEVEMIPALDFVKLPFRDLRLLMSFVDGPLRHPT